MIKSSLFGFLTYSIISYLSVLGVVLLFSNELLLEFLLAFFIIISFFGLFSFFLTGILKKQLVDKPTFIDEKMAHILIISLYLISSLFSIYLGTIFIENIMNINVFGNSNSFWTRLFLQEEEVNISYKYFIHQVLWFTISYFLFASSLKVVNAISIVKNNGFQLNDVRIIKPLLKWFTLFVGIIAVMGIGVNFINYDNFVYHTETDSLYKVIDVNYEVSRIEKVTQEELINFNNNFDLNKPDPTFDFFLFSLIFIIPYIYLIFKNE